MLKDTCLFSIIGLILSVSACAPSTINNPASANERVSRYSKPNIEEDRRNPQRAVPPSFGKIDPGRLNGVWFGTRAARLSRTEDYCLIVENDKAWLQVMTDKTYVLSLAPEKHGQESMTFRVNSHDSQRMGFDKIQIAFSDTARTRRERLLLVLLSQNARMGSTIILDRPVLLPSLPRMFRENAPSRPFFYQDWQEREGSDSYSADAGEARKRLRKMISQLQADGGWRCLAQIHRSVRDKNPTKIVSEESAVNRLYLIYSPSGNSRLIYRLSSKPPMYAKPEGRKYDYPFFISTPSGFFAGASEILLSLQPSPVDPISSQEVPVTIFIFGSTIGDYGDGCSY